MKTTEILFTTTLTLLAIALAADTWSMECRIYAGASGTIYIPYLLIGRALKWLRHRNKVRKLGSRDETKRNLVYPRINLEDLGNRHITRK